MQRAVTVEPLGGVGVVPQVTHPFSPHSVSLYVELQGVMGLEPRASNNLRRPPLLSYVHLQLSCLVCFVSQSQVICWAPSPTVVRLRVCVCIKLFLLNFYLKYPTEA